MNAEPPFILTLIASVALGVFSLFVKRDKGNKLSWPTWLIVPLTTMFSIVCTVRTVPETPSKVQWFYFGIIWLILVRWVFALVRREKNKGWIFYGLLPIIASISLAAMETILRR